MDTYYIDGKFQQKDRASIPVNDLALIRGYGVFEHIQASNGVPLFLEEHLVRLSNSARSIKLSLPWGIDELRDLILKTLEKNCRYDKASVRVIITGGPTENFMVPSGTPRLIIMVSQLIKPPNHYYTRGIKIKTIIKTRNNPGIKAIDYLDSVLALQEAQVAKAFEAIFTDQDGLIREGTTSNIFIIRGERLITPGKRVLRGITRNIIMEISSSVIPVKEENISLKDLVTADEVFLTGSAIGVMPVIKVNDTVIQTGKPGEKTVKIMNLFSEFSTKSFS